MPTFSRPIHALFRSLLTFVLLLVSNAAHAEYVPLEIQGSISAAIGKTTTVYIHTSAGTDGHETTFTYTIPDGLTLNYVGQAPLWTCASTPPGQGGSVTCTSFYTRSTSHLPITLNVPAITTPGTVFVHQATTDPTIATATFSQPAKIPPDLAISTTFPTTFVGGTDIPFVVTVTNRGSASNNFDIIDAFLLSSGSGYFYIPAVQLSGPALQCYPDSCFGSLPAGATVTVRLTMSTYPDTGAGDLRHATSAYDGEFSVRAEVDQTAHPTQVDDVMITATAPQQVDPGSDLAVRVDVSDAGPSSVDSATVSFPTPPGTTFLSIDIGQPWAGCSSIPAPGSAGTIRCTSGRLSPQAAGTTTPTLASEYFTLHLRAPSVPGNVTSTVTITAPNDANPANNSAGVTTLVGGPLSSDLGVTLTAPAGQHVIGDTVTFTATVHNNGPSPATNAVATFTPSAGLAGFPQFPPGCSGTSPVVCTAGTLAAGDTRVFAVQLKASGSGSLVNTVSVASDTADPAPANNTASFTLDVRRPRSDVALTIDPGLRDVNTGAPADVNVILTGTGPDSVSITLTALLPPDVPVSQLPSHCGLSTVVTIQCHDVIDIAVPHAYDFSFLAPQTPGPFTISFTVTTTDDDPNLSNNAQTVTWSATSFWPATDLRVSGTAPSTVASGDTVPFTLTLENRGPADAMLPQLQLSVPALATIESFQAPAGFPCTSYPQTQSLGCVSATPLASSSSLSVTALVRIDAAAGTQIVGGVHVTSSNPDSDPTNNDAQIATVISPSSLRVATDPLSLAATIGEPVAFDVIVSNDGTSVLSNLVLTGALPASWTLSSAAPSSGSCSSLSPLTCHVDTLDSGASVKIRVVASAAGAGTATGLFTAASGTHSALAQLPLAAAATSRHRAARH